MEWIKCSERFPEKEGSYLLFDGTEVFAGTFYECKRAGNCWGIQSCDGFCYGNFEREDRITNWMPLPEPPKE